MAEVTVADILRMKQEGKKIVVWIAYYYEMVRILDRAQPDMFLVGDSGARWLLGHQDNNDVTLEEMIVMGRAVRRAAQHALVVVDLPFMSYQTNIQEAIRNTGRLVKETRCGAVKVEGGEEFAPTVAALVKVGIPVMAHYGLTPQTTAALGGWRRGATLPEDQVWRSVRALQDAGAFSIVLTGLRPPLTERITQELRIPTIAGAYAGDECDGLLGMAGTFGYGFEQVDSPAASYGAWAKALYEGAATYIEDVRAGRRRVAARPGAAAG
jgi:3-methyl-2-oxobutanoate hydroxymethyltransferase